MNIDLCKLKQMMGKNKQGGILRQTDLCITIHLKKKLKKSGLSSFLGQMDNCARG